MKKKIIISGITFFFGSIFFMLLFFTLISGGAADAQSNGDPYGGIQQVMPNMTEQQFLDAMSKPAIDSFHQYGVFPSVTIAQSILESGWGKSGLTKTANNLFGIKAYNWSGPFVEMETNEVYNGMTETIEDKFRVYPTWQDSVMDHGKFLAENSTYKDHGVFSAKDYIAQANALKDAGYATDPNYPTLLITLIKEFNLDKYDKQ